MPITTEDVSRIGGVGPEAARRIVAVASGDLDPAARPDLFPKTCEWVARCLHRPWKEEIAMVAIDEAMGGFGVEPIEPEGAPWSRSHGRAVATYVNVGETYAATVVHDHASGEFAVTSMGDYVEAWEAANRADADEERDSSPSLR